MKKLQVAVLFGGVSSEHEVSRRSACAVMAHLDPEKYELLRVGITKKGEWLLFGGDNTQIPNGEWERHADNVPCQFSLDPHKPGLLLPAQGRTLPVDVVFPVLHGKNGEDGTVQGLLELAHLPYVGCGVLASSVCMDKAVTNMLLAQNGIAEAKFVWFYSADYKKEPAPIEREIAEKLGYPVFVKPANAGSSVGVSKAHAPAELAQAIAVAAHEDGRVVVEEAIDGREVECAVLGNNEPVASVVGEILPTVEFYTYDAKYADASSKLAIPAELPAETAETIRRTAVQAYRMLGCTGLSRVDFFVRRSDGAVLLNELNTLPGFTAISMYPKLFEASGVPFEALTDRLIALAQERFAASQGEVHA